MPEKLLVVVPVDGSAPANRAVGYALTLTAGKPAEVGLVDVQNPQTLDISDIAGVMTVETDRRLAARQSRTALRKAVNLCRKAQAAFVTRAEVLPPAETILRVAREVGANHIVVGTRGLGRLGNLLLGSIATQVVRLAEMPVTLVKGAPPSRFCLS